MSSLVSRTSQTVRLLLLSVVLLYRLVWPSLRLPWTICLLLVGAITLSFWIPFHKTSSGPRPNRWLISALVAFPCYVLFQLLPLPLPFLKIVSPASAEMYEALGSVMPPVRFAPISLVPSDTWEHLLQIAAYISILLLIREIGLCLPHQRWLLALPIIAVAGFEAGLGVVQHTLNIEGGIATGTYVNQDHFAFLLEMVLPFAVMYGIAKVHQSDARSRLSVVDALKAGVAFCLGGLMLASIVYSLSRVALVAAVASLCTLAAVWLWSELKQHKRWVQCAAAIGIVALFLAAVFLLSPQTLTLRYSQTLVAEPRFAIWRDVLHAAMAFPLFGSGFGTFVAAFFKFQTAEVDWGYDFAHNDYLQLIVELGFIGFLIPATLMIAMIAAPLSSIRGGVERHGRRCLATACLGSLTAILIHSFVDFNLYVPGNAMVAFWVLGICSGFPYSPESRLSSQKQEVPRSAVWLRRFSIALGCMLTVYACAWLLLDIRSRSDVLSGNRLCRFGICLEWMVLPDDPQFRVNGTPGYAEALAGLHQGLLRDPAAPDLWCHLGDTLQRLNQIDQARRCFTRARVLAPNIPPMLVKVANFHFSLGESMQAFDVASHVLRITSSADNSIFERYDKSGADISDILRCGLPDDRRAAQAYFRHLLEIRNSVSATQTWDWIALHHFADDRLADEYVRFLISNKDYKTAAQAWADYLGNRRNGYLESNWVFNGDFESEPTGTFFDWTMEGKEADIVRDAGVARSGARSLRIRFRGAENVDFAGVNQVAYVEPGIYHFEAFVRTENINTDQGIGFRIFDLENVSHLDVKTEQILGTTDWRKVEKTFVVHPETHLLEIEIIRQRSRRFDSKVSGVAWIDSARLERND